MLHFIHIHTSWAYVGGEYDLCTGLSKFLKLSNKNIQLHGTVKSNFINMEYSPVTQLHSSTFGTDSANA